MQKEKNLMNDLDTRVDHVKSQKGGPQTEDRANAVFDNLSLSTEIIDVTWRPNQRKDLIQFGEGVILRALEYQSISMLMPAITRWIQESSYVRDEELLF